MNTKDDNIDNFSTKGWLNGLIGILIFSGSLPATKIAVSDFGPIFLSVARASIAGIMAILFLIIMKEKRPNRNQIMPLILISAGVVLGFPLFSALALEYLTSADSMVFLGLLPLSTALFAVIFGYEKPRILFWIFSILGSGIVVIYAGFQGLNSSLSGNLYMFAAVLSCGLGYAIGGKLTKELGGFQVISWSLVISFPLMLSLSIMYIPDSLTPIKVSSWLGLGYVSLFSMFLGFIFWYKGLALGGIASVGQLQLLQPFFGLTLAATILHEQVSIGLIIVTLAIICCVIASKKFAK